MASRLQDPLQRVSKRDFAATLAHWVTRRPRVIAGGILLLVVGAIALLLCCVRLDTEILNLLPKKFDSVQALKTYNSNFTQARELTFALWDESGSADLEEFAEHFAQKLEQEPWVQRVFARSPLEAPEAAMQINQLALPLLLNLPPPIFEDVLMRIDPGKIDRRIQRLRAELEAGSPRAEMQLSFDPLNVIAPALKPLAASSSMEQNLTSPDGTLRLIFAVTTQQDLGPRSAQAVMSQVSEFNERARSEWQKKAPQILVTGRTAYVAEMSRGMEHDIFSTLAASVLIVSGVFYAGFRRLRPLLAIMIVLLLCCLFSVAMGGALFHALNGITIGLCSILVGLGVDFGMVLYGAYQRERASGGSHKSAIAGAIRHLGAGVLFGALTTAAAFLALLRSGSAGFEQLGVLIAIGILFTGALMMTAFFVLIGSGHQPPRSRDALLAVSHSFTGLVLRRPLPVLSAGTVAFLVLCVIAIAPVGHFEFDPDPRALEPANSRAGFALHKISEKMTAGTGEPVLVLVDGDDAEERHRRWERLDSHWSSLQSRGEIKSFATPAAFVLSPERARVNLGVLQNVDFDATRAALDSALAAQGFDRAAFAKAFALIDRLENVTRDGFDIANWNSGLPAKSSWWFLIDRFFGSDPRVQAAYVTPNDPIRNQAQQQELREKLTPDDAPISVSGWSYTIVSLIPWAKTKVIELGAIMIAANIALLLFLYRRLAPLLLMISGLALATGALIATVKIFELHLNLFNVLAFPLVLGVGVDYGIYLFLAMRDSADRRAAVGNHLKPVVLSALTSMAGFGSLAFANNPSLSGLGIVCAIGVAWSLVATLFFVLPAYAWKMR